MQKKGVKTQHLGDFFHHNVNVIGIRAGVRFFLAQSAGEGRFTGPIVDGAGGSARATADAHAPCPGS